MRIVTKEQFKSIYTAKGWTAKELAKHWDYKDSSRIHQIARDETRSEKYNDMVMGLPLNRG